MANKMVTDRSAEASLLSAASATFMREVSPALNDVLSPFVGEGETAPDLTTLPVLASRLVDDRNERLIEADKANIDANSELIEPRKRRNEALSQASSTMYRTRDICRGLYGPELTATIIPDDRRIPKRPKAFLHMGEHVLERLRDVERKLPATTLFGIELERLELSSNFEVDLEELSGALNEVDLKSREAEITQAAKDEAMREFDVTFRAAIKLLEASAILAGKSELAGRVRPTRPSRSSGRGAKSEEGSAEAAASTSDSTDSAASATESTGSAGQ